MTQDNIGAIPSADNSAQMTATSATQDTQVNGSNANAGGDYQQRYVETQAAYTRSQQELASIKSQLADQLAQMQEYAPYLQTVRDQDEFYRSKYAQSKPRSAYDYEDGVDGALRERDQELQALKQKLESLENNVIPQVQQIASYKTQTEFKQNQYRLYQEFGANEFGSAEAFGEFLKALPQFVPTWEKDYMANPSYETLRSAYWSMRGALNYQSDSPFAQMIAAKKQQEFLQKQSNYLGSGAVQYGPSTKNPNQPYMSPISQE
jgi:hypothetical protein